MNKKDLTSAWKVGINSTCSGAWPVIYATYNDPKTNEPWNDEIARGNSVFRADYDPHSKAVTWNQEPAAFKLAEYGQENLEQCYLMAAAPMMAHVLRTVLRSPSASRALKDLARMALEATRVPNVLPTDEV